MKNKSFKAIPVIIVMTLLCQLPVYADALRPAAMHERPRQVIPGRYFSRAKFERYCGGPGGIFTHSADISSKLKQAFSEDPVRIVRVDGERKIEIDIARVQFLDWYERRFGLIPPDKTSTASRNYLYAVVHLLFHKVGFAGILSDRISVENVPAGTLAKFLNEFNRLFGVILDPAGRPAVIDEEFISNGSNSGMLSYLYEEIGAKYPMGLMEDWDSANKLHPVYERFGFRRGEKMVRLRDIIEGCVDEAFMKAKAAGLENVGRSEVDIRKAIRHFEEYAGISSHVPRLRGVIVNEDPKENKFFADLRRQIKEYNFVSDIRNADIALPGGVSVTWGLGMGCPFGGWGLQIHDLAGEYRLCNIYDAVENALLTDEDGILSKGLKGAFGRDVPVSAVTGIEIYHYQEGEYAGMIGVDAVVDFPGLERTQGVFMIYAARSAGDNGKAKSEAEELMRRCAVSAEYTPEIYGDCTGTAREVDKSYMIEMFADEMLADYWEVNVCSREHFGDKAPNKHKRGLGLVVNKGGRNRGEGGFIEDPGIESAMKEESVRAAVFCTDLNTWRFSRYSFNRGDFIFRFIEGERPKVKVISSGNLTAGFDGRPTPEQNVVMGSLLPAWFLYAQERDTVTLMQNIESTGTVANEPLDYVYEPREVFQGMTLGLMDRFGNFGISMAEVWLKEYITRSRTGEILNTLNLKYVSPEYNDFCIAEAHRYLRMLESPAAAQLDTALDLMAFRETWDGI